MLRKITKTAPGCDNIPHWLFSHSSYELAETVAHIFNSTLSTETIPCQWRTAVTSPVSKISNPSTLSDFRPIYVTPILSRILEKLIVVRWLKPTIPQDLVSYQFVFRPTGSTACVIVYFRQQVTRTCWKLMLMFVVYV
jgi:hypothetical protein